MEEEKKSKESEKNNFVKVGELGVESSVLSVDEMIDRIIIMLKDPTIKEYLELLKSKKLCGSSSYLG